MTSPVKGKSLATIASKVFYYVYPPTGWDPLYKKLNGVKLKPATGVVVPEDHEDHETHIRQYLTQARTSVSSFLGLPNNRPPRVKKIQNITIVKNYTGWNLDIPIPLKVLAVAPFLILWNLVTGLIALVYNILKVATEFLPRLGVKLCQHAAHILKEKIDNQLELTKADASQKNPLKLGALYLGYGLAKAGEYACHLIHFIGRAYTSPAMGIRAGWKMGNDLTTHKIGGPLLGLLFAAASVLTTVSLFFLALPVTSAIYAPIIAKFTLAQGTSVGGALGNIFEQIKPAFQFLGNMISPLAKLLPFNTVELGRSLASCLTLVTSGTIFNHIKMKFRVWLHRRGVKQAYSALPTTDTVESGTPATPAASQLAVSAAASSLNIAEALAEGGNTSARAILDNSSDMAATALPSVPDAPIPAATIPMPIIIVTAAEEDDLAPPTAALAT